VSLIHVDVRRGLGKILEGATDTLVTHRPVVVVQGVRGELTSSVLSRTLSGVGYVGIELTGAALQECGYVDSRSSGVFVPLERRGVVADRLRALSGAVSSSTRPPASQIEDNGG
jgi:hypothetical protein